MTDDDAARIEHHVRNATRWRWLAAGITTDIDRADALARRHAGRVTGYWSDTALAVRLGQLEALLELVAESMADDDDDRCRYRLATTLLTLALHADASVAELSGVESAETIGGGVA